MWPDSPVPSSSGQSEQSSSSPQTDGIFCGELLTLQKSSPLQEFLRGAITLNLTQNQVQHFLSPRGWRTRKTPQKPWASKLSAEEPVAPVPGRRASHTHGPWARALLNLFAWAQGKGVAPACRVPGSPSPRLRTRTALWEGRRHGPVCFLHHHTGVTFWERTGKLNSRPGGMSHRKATRVETSKESQAATWVHTHTHTHSEAGFPVQTIGSPLPEGHWERDSKGQEYFSPNSQMEKLKPRTRNGFPKIPHGDGAPGPAALCRHVASTADTASSHRPAASATLGTPGPKR